MKHTANLWIGCNRKTTLIIALICRAPKHANESMTKEKHRHRTVYGILFKTEWLHKPLKLLLEIAKGKLTRKLEMYLSQDLAQTAQER